MPSLFLLSRLALICNLFFLLAASLHVTSWNVNPGTTSLIIILGFFLAFVFNPVANIGYVVALKKFGNPAVKPWLAWTNFIFLLLQLGYIVYRLS